MPILNGVGSLLSFVACSAVTVIVADRRRQLIT